MVRVAATRGACDRNYQSRHAVPVNLTRSRRRRLGACSTGAGNSQAQMAQLPHFVFSPNTLLSAIGLMRGPDTTRPTPAEDWREATVDVIIPAHNEEENIVRCLASVLRQTLRPRQIVLVDDGSSDATAARAQSVLRLPWSRARRHSASHLDRQDADDQAADARA